MKVLRISPSFASTERPRSGLNAFYHSKYSRFPSVVLTEYKNVSYLDAGDNVDVIQIRTAEASLGAPNQSWISMLFAYTQKFLATLQFFYRSFVFINRLRPDLVHLYSPIHLISGLYCKFRFRSVLIVSLHGTDATRLRKHSSLRGLLYFADNLLLLSERMRADIGPLSDRALYLGNGYDQNIFFNKVGTRGKVVISVGNLRWQKDHHTLIKAFSLFRAKNPEYSLWLVGDGPLRESLCQLVSDLGMTNEVFLLGCRVRKRWRG